MKNDILNIQIGTKGFVTWYSDDGTLRNFPVKVAAIYRNHLLQKKFSVRVDFSNGCGNLISGFDKFGFIKNWGVVAFQFKIMQTY